MQFSHSWVKQIISINLQELVKELIQLARDLLYFHPGLLTKITKASMVISFLLAIHSFEGGGMALPGGDEAAQKTVDRLSKAWISFAATGNPDAAESGLPQCPIEWRSPVGQMCV